MFLSNSHISSKTTCCSRSAARDVKRYTFLYSLSKSLFVFFPNSFFSLPELSLSLFHSHTLTLTHYLSFSLSLSLCLSLCTDESPVPSHTQVTSLIWFPVRSCFHLGFHSSRLACCPSISSVCCWLIAATPIHLMHFWGAPEKLHLSFILSFQSFS